MLRYKCLLLCLLPLTMAPKKVSQQPVPQPRYPEYREREQRQATLCEWHHATPTSSEAVDAGFFFKSEETGNYLVCFSCGLSIDEEDVGVDDNLLQIHATYQGHEFHPECEFLNDQLSPNKIKRMKRVYRKNHKDEF